ncbi:MAG: alpha/beta fold hydrolase [Bdellovibrionota bacterium]
MGNSLEPIRIVALHGFLGVPADWREIEGFVKRKFPTAQWTSLNLNNLLKSSNAQTFDALSEVIMKELESSVPHVDLLCGYSLGGRLALHLFDMKPEFFKRVLTLSSSPGITDSTEKKSRIESDQNWAERFIKEPFAKVVADWNSLPIFKNTKEPERNPNDYDPETLGTILRNFSLGNQKDFTAYLKSHSESVTWAYAARDDRYRGMAEQYREMGANNIVEIPEAGHRVIFDAPNLVADLIGKILLENKKGHK